MEDFIYEGPVIVFEDHLHASGLLSNLLLKGVPVGWKKEGVDDWFVGFDEEKEKDVELAADVVWSDPVVHEEMVDSFDEQFEVVGVYLVHFVVYYTVEQQAGFDGELLV